MMMKIVKGILFTITFPALAENTTFWLLIECPLAVTVDPAYVYNTDETIIGQWIDGKPIYRKVLNGSFVSPYSVAHGISGLNEVIRLDGFVKSSSTTRSLNLAYFDDASWNSALSINENYAIVEAGTSFISAHDGYPYKIIIEYTKTTD